MFEENNVFVIDQTNTVEPSLVPTSNVTGYGMADSQTEPAMLLEPTLDDVDFTSLSASTLVDGLEFSNSGIIVSDAAIDLQTTNNSDIQDSLTGQTVVNLEASTASFSNFNYRVGTLGADRLFANLNSPLTVISGNGNAHYGHGLYDYLDLSNVSSWYVTNHSLQLFDVGNGARVFDSLSFTNGAQILFEGLDGIQFSDQWMDLSVDPNDPLFGEQWNLHMMGVHNAWRFTQGSDDVLVGVQDSGLGYNPITGFHPDLVTDFFNAGNVADDFFRNFPDGQFGPREGSHGTGVQGIISATANNGFGAAGINWNSPVFHIDVLDNNREDFSLAQATEAMITQAKNQGQKLIINMSLGGGSLEPNFEALVANNQSNALFVIASGNAGNSSIDTPASLAQKYANVMAVGASWGGQDQFGRAVNLGQRIDYGDFGWGSNYGPGLSLMGPSEVFTAEAAPTFNGTTFGFDNDFNGTSAAAPNVAGVASLVWSVNPNLSAAQVHGILAETAFDLGFQGYDYEYGHGFVNADAAVRRAMAIQWQSVAQWQSATEVPSHSSWDIISGSSSAETNNRTPVQGSFSTDSSWDISSSSSTETDNRMPVQGSFRAGNWAFQSLSDWKTALAAGGPTLATSVEAEPIAVMPVQLTQPELVASEPELYPDRVTEQWNAWTLPSVSIDVPIDEQIATEWALSSLNG